jgi:DNA-binding response OmpR family regulator
LAHALKGLLMIVGYIILGIITGLISSAVAVLLGASLWFAFSLYALVGFATVTLLSAAQIIAGRLEGRAKVSIFADHHFGADKSLTTEPLTSHQNAMKEPSMRVLAVDDDPFILTLVETISADVGVLNVVTAGSGEQALRLLANKDTTFDYLLFDIRMPGMDGIELCRHVRQMSQYHETPIIMLTAMRDIENMGEAFRVGASDYASKPFDVGELSLRLRRAQDKFAAQYDANLASQRGAGDLSQQITMESPERFGDIRRDGSSPLVDRMALSNYLIQLPREDVKNVQVFAININWPEMFDTGSSPQQLAGLLKDVAAVAAVSLGPDRTIMAYTNDDYLLIATHSGALLSATNIEVNIERHLQDSAFDQRVREAEGPVVSVGGPVQLQGAKQQRATFAIDRAIILAKNRALDKQGRAAVCFYKA